ncbi:hypothetical protein OH77DRAFT_1417961 [Trametes cingulata]|nr:hypothetical protein OH77DRAFT_1417961 [Trametes cingulata]
MYGERGASGGADTPNAKWFPPPVSGPDWQEADHCLSEVDGWCRTYAGLTEATSLTYTEQAAMSQTRAKTCRRIALDWCGC